ncbi:MAG: YncE family protein, partial [Deltaproteobacteria bacterium]|nr:YncE family protein [Deltaproteobacteria bacterium]
DHLDEPDSDTWPRPGALILRGDRLLVAVANLSAKFTPGGPGAIHVIDQSTHAVIDEVLLAGRDATTLMESPDGECVFALSAGDYEAGTGFAGNGVVECLDPDTLNPIAAIETGGAPMGESVAATNGRVYVGNAMDARILVFDSETFDVNPEIDLRDESDGPALSFVSALAVDGNGYLYATDFNHDRLFVIDTDTHEILAKFDTCDGPDTLEFVR